jgi:hypothetical protein
MASGMLQIHEEARTGSNTFYHEFLLIYKENKKEVYGFVEGKEDPMFYLGLIENRLPSEWNVKLLRTGNKQKVFEVLDNFDWDRFDHKRICFFVDRDLSEFTTNTPPSVENLYVTDGYSLENSIVTSGTFIRVAKEIYGLSIINEQEELKITRDFERNLHIFQEEMAIVMAQIIEWKRNGSKACLSNVKLGELFIFKNENLEVSEQCHNEKDKLKYVGAFVGEDVSDMQVLKNIEYEFREKDGVSRFVRGKYLFWFFLEFAKKVHELTNHYCSKLTTPPKVKLAIGQKNAMSAIAPRARIPESLSQFVENNYLAYISTKTMQMGLDIR